MQWFSRAAKINEIGAEMGRAKTETPRIGQLHIITSTRDTDIAGRPRNDISCLRHAWCAELLSHNAEEGDVVGLLFDNRTNRALSGLDMRPFVLFGDSSVRTPGLRCMPLPVDGDQLENALDQQLSAMAMAKIRDILFCVHDHTRVRVRGRTPSSFSEAAAMVEEAARSSPEDLIVELQFGDVWLLIEDFAKLVGQRLRFHGFETAVFVLNFCPGKPGDLTARSFLNALPADLGAAVIAPVGGVEAQPTAPIDLTDVFRRLGFKGAALPVRLVSLSTVLVRCLVRGYLVSQVGVQTATGPSVRDVGLAAQTAGYEVRRAQGGPFVDDAASERLMTFAKRMAIPSVITREGNARDAAVLEKPFSTYMRKDLSEVEFLRTMLGDEDFCDYFTQVDAQLPGELSLEDGADAEEAFFERVAAVQASLPGWESKPFVALGEPGWESVRGFEAVMGLAAGVWGVPGVPTGVAVVLHRMCQVADASGQLPALLKAFAEREVADVAE